MPLIRTSNFFFFYFWSKTISVKKGNYSRHRICDWRENLAHSSSPQHRTSDLMNRQMLLVSGCRCSWCLDHDSTRQQAAFSWFLAVTPRPPPRLNLGDHIAKQREECFFYCYDDLHSKKIWHFTNSRGKTSEDTQLSFQTVIWFRKISWAIDRDRVFILSFWWTGSAQPSHALPSRKYVSANDTSIASYT